MSQGGCSRPESSWNRSWIGMMYGKGHLKMWKGLGAWLLRLGSAASFQLDSGREHPPRDMSSSENGHCYYIIVESMIV
eukprot:gene18988-biopygen716